MAKHLTYILLLCILFPSSVLALNESTKPSKINLYLEENPPFSSFNLQKKAQGLYVDYWRAWSVNSGIAVEFHPTLEKDLEDLLTGHIPSIYSGMNINELAFKEMQLIKSELVDIETHYYYLSDEKGNFVQRLNSKDTAIVVGGLLVGSQQLPEFTETNNLVYKTFPGLLEALISLYSNEIDAFVLFSAKDSNKGWLENTLSTFLSSTKSINENNALYYYSTKEQKELFEWIEWGKQGLVLDVMNQPLEKYSAAYWGVSMSMARNISIVIFVLLIFIWSTIAKRKKDNHFKSILDSAPYPLAIFSLNGQQMFYLNDAVKVLFPFKKTKNSFYFEVEENQKLLSEFVTGLSHQSVIETSLTRLIVDKTFHDIEISAKRVHYKRGSAWLCYLKDVTALLRAEKKLIEERSLLRTVLDSIPEQISYKASDDTLIGCNNAWALAHDSSVNDATGKLYASFINEKQQMEQTEQDKQVWQGKPFSAQQWLEKTEQQSRLIQITKVPLPDNQGGILGILSVENDITDMHDLTKQLKDENEQRVKAQHELSKQSILLKTVFEATSDPIVLLDGNNSIIDANPSFSGLLGLKNNDLSGQSISELKIKEGEWITRHNHELLLSDKVHKFEELITHEKQAMWYEINKATFKDLNSQSQGLIVLAKNITLAKQAEIEKNRAKEGGSEISLTDNLTNLPDRHTFDLHFQKMWSESQQQSEMLSLVLCDIDNFKAFNESQGHSKGDLILQAFAELLKTASEKENCFVARYKHDEFIFVFKGGNATKALKLAERIFEKSHSVLFDDKESTLSMGISSIFPSELNNKEMLIAEAQLAIKDAKLSGGNQVGVQ